MRLLCGFAYNYLSLSVRRLLLRGRPIVAISLVEHMGDIVAAEPVARFARQQYPNAWIVWIVRRPYAEIVASYKAVDQVIAVRCLTEWLLLWGAGAHDVAWDLHISERVCPFCNIGFEKPGTAGTVTSETYYSIGNLLTVNSLAAGIPILRDGPAIEPGTNIARSVDNLQLPVRFVAFHARANEPDREWDDRKWEELVNWIVKEHDCAVVEVGSVPHIITSPDPHRRSVCGSLAILETAEVIRRATLFIGIDSGPAHLANAVGTPGVILLGKYRNFDAYTPYSGAYADGTRADLIRANGQPRDIELEDVKAAVAKRLRQSAYSGSGSQSEYLSK